MAKFKTLKRRRQRARQRNRTYGPARALDLATLNSVLAEVYAPVIRKMFDNQTVLLNYLQREEALVGDTSYYRTVPFSLQVPLKAA